MTIYQFLEKYSEGNLIKEPISISSTSLRNYLRENKEELVEKNIVKFIKKMSSTRIEILDSEALYEKLA